jgi:hypothetical protein
MKSACVAPAAGCFIPAVITRFLRVSGKNYKKDKK